MLASNHRIHAITANWPASRGPKHKAYSRLIVFLRESVATAANVYCSESKAAATMFSARKPSDSGNYAEAKLIFQGKAVLYLLL